ncbi:MAG: hypothetical protein H6R04_2045 [Burkholderiaceae bacterium]|nr:hypothetical protein [Burkholderiaceae bacterium]
MSKKKHSRQADACPCGGGVFSACCGRFIEQRLVPQTALELMRSRYSAYVLRDEAYLQQTWYGTTRPERVLHDDDGVKWLSLEIVAHGEQNGDATVEFVARYKLQGRAQKLHEISRFVREDGRWYYLDGSFPAATS